MPRDRLDNDYYSCHSLTTLIHIKPKFAIWIYLPTFA